MQSEKEEKVKVIGRAKVFEKRSKQLKEIKNQINLFKSRDFQNYLMISKESPKFSRMSKLIYRNKCLMELLYKN